MPIHDWTRADAGIFRHFHNMWVAHLCRHLNRGLLPAAYYALTEQDADFGVPDVLSLQLPAPPGAGLSAATSGGLALAEAPPRVRFRDSATGPRSRRSRRGRLVTVRRTNGDRVVAVIEVVSRGNKKERDELTTFGSKAVAYLDAGVHLLVLDLLPPGRLDPQGMHDVIWRRFVGRRGTPPSFQLPPDRRLTLASYAARTPVEAFVEPVTVGDVLPDMPLFLTPDTYINVPLEATYLAAWDDIPPRWQDVIAPPAAG